MTAHQPPPPPRRGQMSATPDTERYVAWLKGQGKSVNGAADEQTHLRLGDWGFFHHGPAGAPLDRAALDKSGHAVTAADTSAWHALLSTAGLDAAAALPRVAFLFRAATIDPSNAAKFEHAKKITAPTLTASGGTVTFQGWVAYPPSMEPMRITITATAAKTTITHESAGTL